MKTKEKAGSTQDLLKIVFFFEITRDMSIRGITQA